MATGQERSAICTAQSHHAYVGNGYTQTNTPSIILVDLKIAMYPS